MKALSGTWRLLLGWLAVLALSMSRQHQVAAFQAKSRDTSAATTRSAFQMNKAADAGANAATAAGTASHSPPPAASSYLAFAPAGVPLEATTQPHQQQQQRAYHAHDPDDEPVEIGVAAAIVACTVSLALGFGLGYGT
jgi:hypothetical protein